MLSCSRIANNHHREQSGERSESADSREREERRVQDRKLKLNTSSAQHLLTSFAASKLLANPISVTLLQRQTP